MNLIKNSIVLLLLALPFLGFSQTNLKATEDKVVVIFVITDTSDIPEANATVRLEGTSDGQPFEAVTDAYGKCYALLAKGYSAKDIIVEKFGRSFKFGALAVETGAGLIHQEEPLAIMLVTKVVETYRLNVYFEHGSYKIKSISEPSLHKLYEKMKKDPKMKIEVGGHTDKSGNLDYNQFLSQKRAEEVKKHLVKKGISGSRIIAKGYGIHKPIADNNTHEGASKNRRTEIKVIQ